VLAHNRALHYFARHPLTEDQRAQLTEVVHGYTGPCDVVAAREGLARLRERYRGAFGSTMKLLSHLCRFRHAAHPAALQPR
jgi:hypothetical protein